MLLLPKDPHAPASERAGAHQLQRPNNHIVAGTSSMRTTVASTTAAIPIPIPTALMTTRSAKAKPKKTAAMIAAAVVMRRPVDLT